MLNIKLMYLAIVLLTIMANDSVFARGGHGGGGYGHGGGYGYGYGGGYGFYGYGGYYGHGLYDYPFYYPPAVVIAPPSTPPVFIQQVQPQTVKPQANYWHYCQNPEGYYPYVRNCPGGWQQIAPQPPAQ